MNNGHGGIVLTAVPSNSSIEAILCAERWCRRSGLLGYWAQSWTGRNSDTGYLQAGTHFWRPRKDDKLSQPHLVLIQRGGI